MGIEATTSTVSATQTTPTANSAPSSSKTNSSDTSFKDEMNKVSESNNGKDKKVSDENDKNLKGDSKTADKTDKKSVSSKNGNQDIPNLSTEQDKLKDLSIISSQLSINDANLMLSNNIQQMIDNNNINVEDASFKNWTFGFLGDSSKNSLKMNESDADFFINITKNENINIQTISAQAQNMVNNGAELAEVKQNVQVSQALLNALSEARENNQPLRIDFDQNISVILRVGRDGALSAQFIPGDKAVEQYLRSNIDSLRASFEEQDLPYSELSYSNTSKEQNKRRREEKRQGE